MEKLSRETLEKWAKQHDWLPLFETANATGRQMRYLTPSGDEVILVYDLEGNLSGTARIPIPLQLIQSPGFPGFPGLHGPSVLGKS
jgi:hypothetical protein